MAQFYSHNDFFNSGNRTLKSRIENNFSQIINREKETGIKAINDIGLSAVETVLNSHPLIKQAAVFGTDSRSRESSYIAFVVPHLLGSWDFYSRHREMMNGTSRRSDFRIPQRTTCKMKIINKRTSSPMISELMDISFKGAAVRNRFFRINRNAQVELAFQLTNPSRRITIRAEVMNKTEEKIGLKFNTAGEDIKKITEWVKTTLVSQKLMVLDSRRTQHRFQASIPCTVQSGNHPVTETETVDISLNGIRVRKLPPEYTPGTESRITFCINEKKEELKGRVVWNNGNAAGIQLSSSSRLPAYRSSASSYNNDLLEILKKDLYDKLPGFAGPVELYIMDAFPQKTGEKENKTALAALLASLKVQENNLPAPVQKDTAIKHGDSSLFNVLKSGDLQHIYDFLRHCSHKPSLTIKAAPPRTFYHLTSNQKRIFMADRLLKENAGAAGIKTFLLTGNWDRDMLAENFKTIVRRHEALRTGFEVIGEEVYQKIHEDIDFTVDYRKAGSETVEEIIRNSQPSFDPGNPPLFKLCLIQLSVRKFILIFHYHRIILDELSPLALMKEMISLLKGEKLPELAVQLKDYAEWQTSLAAVKKEAGYDEYWSGKFRNAVPVLNLTADFPRPSTQSFEGNQITVFLPENLMKKITDLAVSSNVTTDMVFLAAFNTLLYRYTGQESLAIGTSAHRENMNRAAGMFANTILLNSHPAGEKQFDIFLEEISAQYQDAGRDQEFQFDLLLEKFNRERDPSRNPLFDAAFTSLDYRLSVVKGAGFQCIPLQTGNRNRTRFDLTLEIARYNKGIAVTLEYCTGLFKQDTAARMINYFLNILQSAARDPREPLSKIDILSVTEKQTILYEFNKSRMEYPADKTITRLFEEQAKRTPDNTALVYGDRQLSYRELNDRAGQLADYLAAAGVMQETPVGILMKESFDLIIVILGILKAGGAYVPMDPSLPANRLKMMVEDSGMPIVVCDDDRIEFMLEIRKECSPLNSVLSPGSFSLPQTPLHRQEPAAVSSRNLAYMIYTSGSTGIPKGVMVEHRSLVNLCFWHNSRYSVTASDRAVKYAGLGFDASVWEIFPYLIAGAALYIIPAEIKYDPELLNRYFEENRITIGFLPTQMCEEFMNMDNHSLRIMLTGGDKLKKFIKKNYRLVNNYGPTENTVVTTSYDVEEYSHNIPIGKPVNNNCLYILDKHNNIQPVGVPGELCIGGDSLARGYAGRPELNASKFVDNPLAPGTKIYRTGDLARWLPDGNIEFLGRIDQQVKIRGFRIELGEIESCLGRHPAIHESVVIDLDDKDNQKFLCAYYTAAGAVPAVELKTFLASALPEYMIPSYFVHLDEIPLNSNGKIDRKALPSFYKADMDQESYLAPEGRTEKVLVNLWQELLGIKKIGINDNFFNLGGHSLKATVLATRIQKSFHVKIPLQDIFKSPTIREIAHLIETAGENSEETLKPAQPADYYPLSSAQQRMYIVEQLEKGSISYNEVIVMTMEGRADLDKLEKIFRTLIRHHEILRTGFLVIGDNVYQKVYDDMDFSIRYEEGSTRKLEEMVNGFKNSYDLKNPPFFRVGIIKTGMDKYFFVLGAHHIIMDGTSLAILMKEVIYLYRGDILPELRVQYKDYAVWQNTIRTGSSIKKQEAYWLKKFEEDIPVLNLPTDYPRPALQSFEGSVYSFRIGKRLTAAVLAMSRMFNTTLYMTLLAAFKVLLFRYTEQNDMEIGSGIANRNHSDLSEMLGMFVNMIIIRSHLSADMKFSDYLAEIRELAFEAFENQDCQFDVLVHQLNRKRDPSRNPLFDAAFVLQNVDDYEVCCEELDFRKYPVQFRKTSKFDLTLDAAEEEDEIVCHIEYCTRLFREETIKRMSDHFLNIIGSVTTDPHVALADIEILSDLEKVKLLLEFNNTEFPYPQDKTITTLFEEQVGRTPDKPVLVHNGITMSYRELDAKANQLARFLMQKIGTKPDTLVAVLMEESLDMFVAIMGILKAGAAYVPIDPSLPENRIKEILTDSGIETVLSARQHIKVLNRLQWECPAFDHYLCMDSADVYAEKEAEKNHLMDAKLWHYVGENAATAIAGGGWKSSYTGEEISRKEMQEYTLNIHTKLKPFLHRKTRVLEIGCASGLTMFTLAPHVGYYYGTDLSGVIINKNREKVVKEGIGNIKLQTLAAHEIDQVPEKDFDIVIINSVIQCFHGHNYLRDVIMKAIGCLKDTGLIFIGDIMDQDSREDLINSLTEFKKSHPEAGYKTKTDFSAELFVSRRYFEDLAADTGEIKWALFSGKIHTIKNELSLFRYDAMLQIDKKEAGKIRQWHKHKHQYSNTELLIFSTNRFPMQSRPENIAYVIYTSGSTGKPKGVLVEHRSLVNLCTWHNHRYSITSGDNATKYAGLGFDASVWEIFPYMITGATIHIIPGEIKFNPELLNTFFENNKITISFLPTQMCEEFMKKDNHSLRLVLTGGDKLKQFMKKEYQLVNNYGPTENTVVTTSYDVNAYNHNIPIGKPVYNCQIYILSKTGKLQPAGVPGELFIAGDSLSRGYLKRPELNREKFIDNPFTPGTKMYRTGDLARWLPDGNIEFFGRIDFQVKIRGFRIELGEIESRLLKHDDINEAIVVTKEGEDNQQYLCAYFASGKKLNAVDLKAFLASELPHYMIPAHFVQMDKIPLNHNGKIDRKALPDPFGLARTGVEFVSPETPVQKQLAVIWQNILNIKSIGIHDNFFDLGGHSLKITIMAEQIRSQLGIDIPLLQIFQTPTIKELEDYIKSKDRHLRKHPDPNLVLLRKTNREDEKILFLVHPGTGEVSPYWRFAKQITDEYTIYGIKASRLPGFAPADVSIEQMAENYFSKMKLIQKKGPYRIMGWCLGGTIAFEIVHQLEKRNEEVIFCSLVNTELPGSEKTMAELSPASEKAYIHNWLQDDNLLDKIGNITDVTSLWQAVVDYFSTKENGLELLKSKVSSYDAHTIPHFAHASVEEIIYFLNMSRSLDRARNQYNPADCRIDTTIHFFEPQEIKGRNMDQWQKYTDKQVHYYEVAGSHFSIFKMPDVEKFAALFNRLL